MNIFKLLKLFDMHVHLREGAMLRKAVPSTARYCSTALVMPNTKEAITTPERLLHYREEIVGAVPDGLNFVPLMTFEIREDTNPAIIPKFRRAGAVAGKAYPYQLTTNSHHGVRNYENLFPTLKAMEKESLILCLHGEQPDLPLNGRQWLDAEPVFADKTLPMIAEQFPDLQIVLEHISARESVEVVEKYDNVAATITAQHMVLNHDHVGGYRMCPNNFCKPVAKMEEDRLAVLGAAISGNPKFFLGSDSAPHPIGGKARLYDCCAGCYTAPILPALLTQIFDEQSALDKLPDFVQTFGAAWYGLGGPEVDLDSELTMVREPWRVPEEIDGIALFMAGEELSWRVLE